MELREIITFLQVAQHKSFSKAARQLGYSQAAVTIQIKQLESELGVHLFDRIGKQTTLTHQGSLFYEYACDVVKSLERAKDALAESEELTGHLSLGAIESVCGSLLPELLTRYHTLHPNVSVSIVTDSPENLLDMMNSNALDIVYFMDKRMYDPKWVKVMEIPENIVFVTAGNDPLLSKKDLTLPEVVEQPFLLTEKNASYRLILDQYLTSKNLSIRPFLEIGNTEFIIRMLKRGLGVSFLPEFTIRQNLLNGDLSILNVQDFSLRIWRQMVYHKDKWVTREMAEFIRLAEEMDDMVHAPAT